MPVKVTALYFGTYEGKEVTKYTIAQIAGIHVSVINYGATVTNISVPDKKGTPADIVLGFETLDGYITASGVYMGSVCGRFANRIANGRFGINGSQYLLSKNEGNNILHGGFKGFDKVYWQATVLPEGDGVLFSYSSKDGEEGFPGNLKASVCYRVADNALHIEYRATTDKATPVNLTSHCYFNLSGTKEDNILRHELQLNADHYLEINTDGIPTGSLIAVKETAMDFTNPRVTGSVIANGGEFDHCWALNKMGDTLTKAASLVHKESGRIMTVYTTQPGIQFYSGNAFDERLQNTKQERVYGKYAGLCLEAQHFPDSPNHTSFPCTILYPGKVYNEKTIYSFSVGFNH